MTNLVLAAAQVPATDFELSGVTKAIIMTICCLLVLFLASRGIERPHEGARMPLPLSSQLFNDISVPGFIGAMSFGHVLGTLSILAASSFFS